MSKIKVMKEVLANKIAAGEVIERPLSVVKELVENSLDAQSSMIRIELKDSGIKKIEIKDNGSGMSETDLPLSIKRHATSKLYDDKDLFKISTLGFRGEALPSIYAVSQVTICSSTDGIGGKKLTKVDDENYTIDSMAMNKGTIITIDNLFYNTPVRYKHLSNTFYELSLVVQYINKLALIHPQVSFTLINNDNQLIKTSGNGDIRAIIANQYSAAIASNMLSFKCHNEHFEIEMYSSHPHDTRSRKSHITIGLNERLIRNYDIENKIVESYGSFLHTGQYPIAFINIKVNYALIDVNIHPTKQQVKISLVDSLLDLISENIKKHLGQLTYMAEPVDIKNVDYSEMVEKQNKELSNQLDTLFSDKKQDRESEREARVLAQPKAPIDSQNSGINPTTQSDVSPQQSYDVFKLNKDNVNHTPSLFSLEADDNKVDDAQKLPLFNYVGTLHNTYIVCENGEGLYLIDQHAAQERINYELIVDSFKERQFVFQQSLLPIIITLSDTDNAIFAPLAHETENFGFKVEEFGVNSYKVTEVDSWISKRVSAETDINEIVNTIIDKKSTSFEHYFDEVAISMACKKSIKAHQRINQSEAENLLDTLNSTRQPYTCPHGRPVIVKITTKEIEKMFKRVF
ncbi:DNA mismatch repair endonuclease MutL [Mollicutes bacterium LVI A0039]|nr:DNA mismatch repair endonuclease MutL [Mollicutes bacterium LVI A0039]